MDDDAEDGARMRFSLDTDYEGGQWIGGEYFYSKNKKQRKLQSRDDALYGVFNESDSDEGGGGGRRRKKEGDVIEKGSYSKPVAFVSKGVTNPNEDLQRQQKEAEDQAQDAASAGAGLGFAGLGFGGRPGLGAGIGAGLGAGLGAGIGAGLGHDASGDAEVDDVLSKSAFGQRIKERAERRKETEREKAKEDKKARALGQSTPRWAGEGGATGAKSGVPLEAQSKMGIGMKLLEKMGYKGGGLGKNQQGIVAPIEAKMRPKNMGMGFGDFNEKEVGLPGRPGDEAQAQDEAVAFAPAADTGQQKEKLWRKKTKKKKFEYKTAAQLLEEKHAAGAAEVSQTILDMRGPQARVLTNLENIGAEQALREDDTPMPELQHNLRLLVDLAEADIQALDLRLRNERLSLVALREEKERAEAKAVEQQRQLQSMEAIVGVLEGLEESKRILDQQEVIAAFRGLKDKFPEDYMLFNVPAVALSHAKPLISSSLQGWNPLAQPRHGLVDVAMWQEVLSRGDASDRAIFFDADSGQDVDPYVRLVAQCVLPHVRSAVTNLWEPREPEPVLRFLEDWKASLPEVVLQDILQNLVMPKLAAAVNAWNPLQETIPIHQWLHPWLPHLGASMQSLYPTIQYRLGTVLQAWHPSDSSALAMLAPWHSVFETAGWEALLSRSIMPKLIGMMRTEFVVNPQAQVMEPFKWAMAWAGVMPSQHMVALLDAAFFPQWHQVLYHWLTASPNFEEVTRWYLGWKAEFPEALLGLERVRHQLNVALDMMNQAVEGMPVLQPGARENVSFLRSTEHEAFSAQAAPKAKSAAHLPAQDVEMEMGVTAGEMSLKEVVEMFAEQHDVKFLPKPGRMHEGLPVYSFGTVSLVVDSAKQVLLAQNEHHEWEPVTMQGLLDMHRKRGGRWA